MGRGRVEFGQSHVSQGIKKRTGEETLKNEGGAYHLPGSHADGLDAEFSTTHVE
jgi:hypothetical protein